MCLKFFNSLKKIIRNIKKASLAYMNNEHIHLKQKGIDIGEFDYSIMKFLN